MAFLLVNFQFANFMSRSFPKFRLGFPGLSSDHEFWISVQISNSDSHFRPGILRLSLSKSPDVRSVTPGWLNLWIYFLQFWVNLALKVESRLSQFGPVADLQIFPFYFCPFSPSHHLILCPYLILNSLVLFSHPNSAFSFSDPSMSISMSFSCLAYFMYAVVQFVSPARVLTAVRLSCLVQCIFVPLHLLYPPSLTMLIYEVTVTWTDRSCPGAYLRRLLASGPSSYRPLAAPHLSELCLRWRPFLTFLLWAFVAEFNHYRDLQPSLQITWYLLSFSSAVNVFATYGLYWVFRGWPHVSSRT